MRSQQSKYEALVSAHYRELYSFAYGMCRHRETAEDLVQECFSRAWKSIAKLRDEQAARAWLFSILRREHARLYARQRPEVRAPEDLPELPDQGYDASTEAFVLRRVLHRLDTTYREPLLLQVIGGFSCAEIGQLLGISENAAMTRLYRARRTLRQLLEPAEQVQEAKP